MNNLPNQFSIEIQNEEQSRAAQEKLFELGYCWRTGDQVCKNMNGNNQLQINYYNEDGDKRICRGTSLRGIQYSFEEFMKLVNPQEKIYCVPDEIEAALIHKMVEERGMDSFSEGYASYFMLGRENNQPFDKIGSKNGAESYGYKLVPVHEFIYALGQISAAPKEVVIDVLPWILTIRGEKFDLGCRENNDISILKNALEYFGNISSLRFSREWLGMEVYGGRDGFRAGGKFVSWETWDKFVKEVKTSLNLQ